MCVTDTVRHVGVYTVYIPGGTQDEGTEAGVAVLLHPVQPQSV